ncbi:MAG: multicopper oxidase domain-containing protein [Jatrophihabitantaceae bacterium]
MTAHIKRPSERVQGLALGTVLVLVAMAVAIFVGRDTPTSTSTVTSDGTRIVAVQLADMRITPSVISVPVGTKLVLKVTNVDAMRHDLYIDGGPETPLLAQGQSATLTVGAVTRTMQGWCTVPGHKAAGMTMTIAISGAATATQVPPMQMPSTGTGATPAINFNAEPGPDFTPFDPALKPASGATEHKVTFTISDTLTEVAPGVRQTLWTYNGTAPGPILRGHVGDLFTITLVNHGDMAHSIDFHAGSVDPDASMRSIDPGQSLVYQFKANHSGAWLYHCSTMPMSLHIANGMFGAVIIDPPDLDHVSQEFVMVQSELYLGAQDGIADETKIAAGKPDAVVFNGYADQYVHAPIKVRAGERIRVWVVDAGPQFGTSFHVVGAQFDTVFKEGAYLLRPNNAEDGAAQTLDLAPAQGGFVEFVLPATGHYRFIDHAMVDAERGAEGVFAATG